MHYFPRLIFHRNTVALPVAMCWEARFGCLKKCFTKYRFGCMNPVLAAVKRVSPPMHLAGIVPKHRLWSHNIRKGYF
jgi:hypothetical protein